MLCVLECGSQGAAGQSDATRLVTSGCIPGKHTGGWGDLYMLTAISQAERIQGVHGS